MTARLDFIFNWDEAVQAGVDKVGGKGWNLGRLARYGFNIPPGIVISTELYQQFIEHNGLTAYLDELSQVVTLRNLEQYDTALRELRERIMAADIPAFQSAEIKTALSRTDILGKALAVRSSASAEDSLQMSFAGIHASTLNVCGQAQIMDAIKGCYASLWTPQAVAYRRRFELGDQLRMAVVIMQMVDAQAAGVAFSCDPQTGRRDRLVVHANYGLGESVVNGSIEPDSYSLDSSAWYAIPPLAETIIGRKEGIIKLKPEGGTVFVSQEPAAGQVLQQESLGKLGLLILRIFESLGEGEQHLDIEWAFDGREFFVLQARPVTVLPCYTFGGFKGRQEVWSNGNYRDAAPMVLSPLHRRVMKNIIDTVQFTSLSKVDYPIPDGFQFSRLIKGRLYCNISALQWTYYDNTGVLPSDFNPFWGGHQPEIQIPDTDPLAGEQGRNRLERMMKSFALMTEEGDHAHQVFAEVIDAVESMMAGGFASLSDAGLIDKLEQLSQIVRHYSENFTFLAGAGNMPMISLIQKLFAYLGERTMIMANGLMVGGEAGITSADHGYRLLELSRIAIKDQAARHYLQGADYAAWRWEQALPDGSPFKTALAAFINDFGHRAVYEMDIINPRWQEDPSYLFEMIKSMMAEANLDQWKAGQAEKYQQAWQELAEKVPECELDEIKIGIRQAQEGAALREMTKSVMAAALNGYRMIALEIGRRLQQRGILQDVNDIFFCSWPDLTAILNQDWNGEGLQVLVADRRSAYEEKEKIPAPDLVIEEQPVFSQASLDSSGKYWQGIGAATGTASGAARIINNPAEGCRLQPGEILVAPSTDPGWTPLFLKASALIMETGGFLSHGSIVAREFGVPAVVNVAGVMRQLEDGQLVTVDGDEGRVYV